MATALSLHPAFRQSVGFDHFHDLFETLTRNDNHKTFPPYDIAKIGENHYSIVMAVAGYSDNDIDISVEKDQLKISGKIANDDAEEKVYLHQGIAKRSFERKFQLADYMLVNDAKLVNGLLTIAIERKVPEEKKPQVITINH